jgi:hypothetical protein
MPRASLLQRLETIFQPGEWASHARELMSDVDLSSNPADPATRRWRWHARRAARWT